MKWETRGALVGRVGGDYVMADLGAGMTSITSMFSITSTQYSLQVVVT